LATLSPSQIARNRLARLHSAGAPDPAAVIDARRELAAANCERAIQKALAAAPPLTADQRARLAALLVGGAK
jgi:hypothetical protein